ncbi:carbohydrate-binding module family 43 protein [Ramaria rubella]|nr:carbohydrate-binding module family 43 protein [Ramaria rubella]
MVSPKILAVLAGVASTAFALPNVTVGGRYLYQEDGTRFYIKGIAYQQQGTIANDTNDAFPEPTNFVGMFNLLTWLLSVNLFILDPLADSAGCTRDLPFLKQLGVNSIRAYSVNSSLNHDSCMQAFSGAGIYAIIDLSLPVNGSIDRSDPSWTTNLLDLYLNTVNAFLKYDNVLAFNVGNEIVAQADTMPNITAAAPYIKAAARDVKAYLKSKGSTALVGYASTDGPSTWRDPLAHYLGCDSDATSIDLFGLNNYIQSSEWCGDSNFQSAYAETNAEFSDLNIPAYFSEFGCNTSPPRLWTEVQALFGEQMVPNWSGGLAFSYFPAQGGFGMITLSPDNTTVTTSDDFTRLQAQYANVTFINSPSQSTAGQTQFPACPQPNSTFLASSSLPPTPDDAACQCLAQNTFTCNFKETNNPNEAAVIGTLTDTACSLFGQQGGSCSPIGGSGSSGQYGALSFCDPVTKLDYVFSAFYEITNRNAQSCDFSGNATIVSNPPASSAVAAAATSCLSNVAATFTPTAPAGSGTGGSSTSTSGSSSPKNNAATGSFAIFASAQSVFGVAFMTLGAFFGGLWTLLA